MPIPCLCLHSVPYFSCHRHWFCLHILHRVPVLFSIIIPTFFNILMKCFSHLFHLFFIASSISRARASPTAFAPRGHVKSHANNNEEMAFVYTEMHVFLALLVQERSYEDSVGHTHSAGEYKAVSCKNAVKYLHHL